MRLHVLALAAFGLLLAGCLGGDGDAPPPGTATPAATATATPSPPPTATPTRTAAPSPSPTATPSPPPTPSPTPIATPTPSATPSPTPTVTPTPSPTATATPSASTPATPQPIAGPDMRRAVEVSAAWNHTCALLKSGEVACWGKDGDGAADDPRGRFRSVSAGGWFYGSHTCALRESGRSRLLGSRLGWPEHRAAGPLPLGECGLGAFLRSARVGRSRLGGLGRGQTRSGRTRPAGSFPLRERWGPTTRGAVKESGELVCWGAKYPDPSGSDDGWGRSVGRGSDGPSARRTWAESAQVWVLRQPPPHQYRPNRGATGALPLGQRGAVPHVRS